MDMPTRATDKNPESTIRLAEKFVAMCPRERDGSRASNRFDYQKTWALCHLLHLHSTVQQYILIIEFHDDIVVFDREDEPTEVEFYQVKTRRAGQWKKRDLLKKDSKSQRGETKLTGTPQSIFGKLLDHCHNFSSQVKSLNLVSNARFDLPLSVGSPSIDRDSFNLSELNPDILSEVRGAIKAELGFEEDIPWERVFLMATSINILDHQTYGVGKLAEFLDRRSPNGKFAVQALFRTLYGELGMRAGNEWHPNSFRELCRNKGISYSEFESFLRLAEHRFDPEEQMKFIKEQLFREGCDFRAVSESEAAWRRYGVESIDPTNLPIQKLKEAVLAIIRMADALPSWRTLREFVEEVEIEYARRNGSPQYPLSSSYLKGAILYEYGTAEGRQLPTFDSEHTAKAI